MLRIALLIAVLFMPISANAQEGQSPFCDAVNKARTKCGKIEHDCEFMMNDMDLLTLDTFDRIKSCPAYAAPANETPIPEDAPKNLNQLVCCMNPGLR
jgi:hypothetical protein